MVAGARSREDADRVPRNFTYFGPGFESMSPDTKLEMIAGSAIIGDDRDNLVAIVSFPHCKRVITGSRKSGKPAKASRRILGKLRLAA